jgi:hypothetical protein
MRGVACGRNSSVAVTVRRASPHWKAASRRWQHSTKTSPVTDPEDSKPNKRYNDFNVRL